MYYVYVLLGKRESKRLLYVGFTEDLKNRFYEHESGEVKTTKVYTNITLVYYEACINKTDARKRELQLKTGFGRAFLNRR